MKFRVTMKTPDALSNSIKDVAENEIVDVVNANSTTTSDDVLDKYAVIERWSEDKWFEYGEYLTVEIDTEAKTCTVVERR